MAKEQTQRTLKRIFFASDPCSVVIGQVPILVGAGEMDHH